MSLEKTEVEKLIDVIKDSRSRWLRSRIYSPSTQPYFYLSNIHSCKRNLYYQLTEGNKREPVSEWLQALFDSGNMWERQISSDLLQMGIQLSMAQETIDIKKNGELIGRGKIDGVVVLNGKQIPVEIKSMDPNMFKRIREGIGGVDDLLMYEYTEKYVKQLLMYLYGKNLNEGFFIIVDLRGHWKMIPVFLGNHLDIAETALKDMEDAYYCAKKKTVPDRIHNYKTCSKCQFQELCLPNIPVEDAETLNDPDIEALIARHEELKPLKKEYDSLHDELAFSFRDKKRVLIGGRYDLICHKQKRRTYDYKKLDDDTLKNITIENEINIIKIKDIQEKEKNENV